MAYLGEEIKKLGFGLMRLPMNGEDIDLEQTKKMVDLFMEKGFTYFDTAYVYGEGQSEYAARHALVKRYPRESFQLATKLPAWDKTKTAEEVKQYFYTSLERTEAGYFDYYLLHNLGGERTEIFENLGLWDFVKELKAKGLIRHFGFSFHDNSSALDKLLTAHPEAEFVQLQINYADWEHPEIESRKCYEVARSHNKPVIIMEPVKGGTLASLPDSAVDVLKSLDKNASVASWAIRFAASLDGVITVLSGMSNIEQMEDNLSFMENFKRLSNNELESIEKVRNILDSIPQVACTNCKYCVKDCPQNIPINKILGVLNGYDKYNNFEGAKARYNRAANGCGKASDCIDCKNCESVCPQHIKITEHLKRAASLFEKA
jgi:predicted aldo/keto reductase-like oxidoreductase